MTTLTRTERARGPVSAADALVHYEGRMAGKAGLMVHQETAVSRALARDPRGLLIAQFRAGPYHACSAHLESAAFRRDLVARVQARWAASVLHLDLRTPWRIQIEQHGRLFLVYMRAVAMPVVADAVDAGAAADGGPRDVSTQVAWWRRLIRPWTWCRTQARRAAG